MERSTGALARQTVNHYLAHKQLLLASGPPGDVIDVTRHLVALHATLPAGPYLSLWARMPGFERSMLDRALYHERTLARLLCMRTTLHIVPADELPLFFQACAGRQTATTRRSLESLLVRAGLCDEEQAGATLASLRAEVLNLVLQRGPSTVRQINAAIPALRAKIRHSAGKAYEGEFSVGSRLVPGLCALGALVRARPRGTWQSNLHTYAAPSEWLPGVSLASDDPREARTWLVRRYLAAFGPATADDVRWWTGLSARDTRDALEALQGEVVGVRIAGLGDGFLMLAPDAERLRAFPSLADACVALLPSLDPTIMAYRDRRRFLPPVHEAKVLDRAGNAMPTVWVDGCVAGAWGQRRDGRIVYGSFEPLPGRTRTLLDEEVARLEAFLGDDRLRPRSQTAFTRALTRA
jgi:hypothetical protein